MRENWRKYSLNFSRFVWKKAFVYKNLSGKDLENTIFLAEDQAYIREELKKRSLVAFVNDGAILPRESGISSKPMKGSVTFSSPEKSSGDYGASP